MFGLPIAAYLYNAYANCSYRPSAMLHARTTPQRAEQAKADADTMASQATTRFRYGHASGLQAAANTQLWVARAAQPVDFLLGTSLHSQAPKPIRTESLEGLQTHLRELSEAPTDGGLAGVYLGLWVALPAGAGALLGAACSAIVIVANHILLDPLELTAESKRAMLQSGAELGALVGVSSFAIAIGPELLAVEGLRCVSGAAKALVSGVLSGIGYGLGAALGTFQAPARMQLP